MMRFNRINVAHLSPSLASQLLQGDGGFQRLRLHRMAGQKRLVTLRFSKVTCCKSETASRRYRRNGYTPNPIQSNPIPSHTDSVMNYLTGTTASVPFDDCILCP
jgi:hypothetical protein